MDRRGLLVGTATDALAVLAARGERPAATMTLGLDVLVQLVIAAISTEPWPMRTSAFW